MFKVLARSEEHLYTLSRANKYTYALEMPYRGPSEALETYNKWRIISNESSIDST